MAKCRFCDQKNPPGVDRCQNCGAWIEAKFDSAPPTPTRAPQGEATPLPEPDSFEGQLLALLEGGQKIQAVKLYRLQMGCDLKAAKDAVEALAASHGIVAKGGGCAGVVLLMLVAAVMGAWFLIS
jgi:hypothetical protein